MTEAKGKIIEGAKTRIGYVWHTTREREREREREKVVKHLILKTDAKLKGKKNT
jgi:hypothetical protein